MKKNFLKKFDGLDVLVTGADGFVSSHLCEALIKNNANVTALLKRNSSGIFKNLDQFKDILNIRGGDTQDLSLLHDMTKETDLIYHLAAQSHVGHSLYNPYETVFNDIISTLNILEVSRKNDIKRVIDAGSSEIYGDPKFVPIDEKHPLQPRSPYAAAKAASENLLESYYHSYKLPVVMSRFFNIYGPRQGLDQVIPKFILQALNNQNITIYGNGKQTRDYTFVTDVVDAYLLLGVTPKIEHTVMNFSSQKELMIKDLAELIIDLTKSNSKLKFDKKLRTGETPRLLGNSKLAKKMLGWKPNVSIEDGLKETVQFYQERKELVNNLKFMV